VISAKTQAAFDNIREQFRRRCVKKLYWALVWGSTDEAGIIDFRIAHDPRDRSKMLALPERTRGGQKIKSWPSLTRYRRIYQRKNLSLVELHMETGVTHQLRVHLAAIGHPIVGDRLYGKHDSDSFGLRRHFLHAKELALRHPRDGGELRLEAALAAELKEVLTRLKLGELGGRGADPL
jgi:23S rRNA pseudouridine1911/1915/1917 synthase